MSDDLSTQTWFDPSSSDSDSEEIDSDGSENESKDEHMDIDEN